MKMLMSRLPLGSQTGKHLASAKPPPKQHNGSHSAWIPQTFPSPTSPAQYCISETSKRQTSNKRLKSPSSTNHLISNSSHPPMIGLKVPLVFVSTEIHGTSNSTPSHLRVRARSTTASILRFANTALTCRNTAGYHFDARIVLKSSLPLAIFLLAFNLLS